MIEKEENMDALKSVIKAMQDSGESPEYILAVTASFLGVLNYKVWKEHEDAKGDKKS